MPVLRSKLEYVSALRGAVPSRVVRAFVLLATVPLLGAVGFKMIEGWTFFDSLYMAVISITTVGYTEVHALSDGGRAFVMGYLVLGLASFLYALSQFGEWVLQSNLGVAFARVRGERRMDELNEHYIVCGFGRMGEQVCSFLAARQLPFVLIDNHPDRLQAALKLSYLVVEGDSTHDEVLEKARIARARGLCAVLSEDADNLLLVMSARLLCPELQIVARALERQNVAKLEKAGANRVVNLFSTAAQKAFETLTNPSVQDIGTLALGDQEELDFREIIVQSGSRWAGKTVADLQRLATKGVVFGLKRPAAHLELPAKGHAVLQASDKLLIIGRADQIDRLADGAGA